ncbi:MAG: hypothetical protein IPK14_26990 [Blastocatellia bacterium]|nr:hypothetical protein [Blastocatellia bacterium]MBL8192915.1 hypothetical protein [Blastocatellia bacterium]MBN8725988.1 hypothetical protein [Acidobacteriota bacterium]
MSLLSSPSSNTEDMPRSEALWKRILKQVLIAVFASSVMLAIYLMVVNDRKEDEVVGKHAYVSKNGSYVGEIKGKGLKKGIKVYYIKQATGSIISMSESYIEVKDSPPKYDF